MKDKQQIITIEEFKKALGSDSPHLSDSEIENIIELLDFMAQKFIKTLGRK